MLELVIQQWKVGGGWVPWDTWLQYLTRQHAWIPSHPYLPGVDPLLTRLCVLAFKEGYQNSSCQTKSARHQSHQPLTCLYFYSFVETHRWRKFGLGVPKQQKSSSHPLVLLFPNCTHRAAHWSLDMVFSLCRDRPLVKQPSLVFIGIGTTTPLT